MARRRSSPTLAIPLPFWRWPRARVWFSNLVGPYTLYGRPVIEACIEGGAHYADLTGEIPFVRRVIGDFEARAVQAEVKLVQVCGFECLPPDLAVLLAVETAQERWGEALKSVELEVSMQPPPGMPRFSDSISGGTLQSLVAVMGGEEDPSVAADPAALVTDPVAAAEIRRVSPISVMPRQGPGGTVIAPMAPAAFINPPVIQRTAALMAAQAGRRSEPFCYREGMVSAGSSASLPLRYGMAGILAGMQAGFVALARAQPAVRRRVAGVLGAVFPAWALVLLPIALRIGPGACPLKASTTAGHEVRVEVAAQGHPGYLATARMLGEAGLLLASAELTPKRSGCLTPAAALGSGCVERFRHARVHFSSRRQLEMPETEQKVDSDSSIEADSEAIEANAEAIRAWDGPLYDRFVRFREIVTTGLGAHGEAALELFPPRTGERVLDLGCGFGDTTQRIAGMVGAKGEVLGVDAAANFIETARGEALDAGLRNVSFAVADVQAADLGADYDMAFSRFGTMFFANPVAALRNVRRALKPGGRLVMVVWRRRLDNDWLYRGQTIVEGIVSRPRGVRRAHLRPRTVLDVRCRYHQRGAVACGLQGRLPAPLRSADWDRQGHQGSDRHGHGDRPGRRGLAPGRRARGAPARRGA